MARLHPLPWQPGLLGVVDVLVGTFVVPGTLFPSAVPTGFYCRWQRPSKKVNERMGTCRDDCAKCLSLMVGCVVYIDGTEGVHVILARFLA